MIDNLDIAKKAWNIKKGKDARSGTTDYNLLNLGDGKYNLYIQPSKSLKEDPVDWIRNFSIIPERVNINGTQLYMHKGFYEGYLELMEALLPQAQNTQELNLTGYSLGAGIAPAVNLYYMNEGNVKINTPYLFGAPNPFHMFDIKGFLEAKEKCSNMVSFKYGRDIVSREPNLFLGYGSVGKQYQIKQDKQVYKDFLDWFKRPFEDHGRYPSILKEK